MQPDQLAAEIATLARIVRDAQAEIAVLGAAGRPGAHKAVRTLDQIAVRLTGLLPAGAAPPALAPLSAAELEIPPAPGAAQT